MLKKVLALVAVALVATAGAAQAQTYPPPSDSVVVIESTLVPGGPVTVSAQTYQGGASVSFTINGETTTVGLGSANANSAGVARLASIVPGDTAPGSYTLTAAGVGADGKRRAVTTAVIVSNGEANVAGVTIERPAASGGGTLPGSGSDSDGTPMRQIALGAAVAGGLLILVGVKRFGGKSTADAV